MMMIRTLSDAVRDAWASIPAPQAEDLKYAVTVTAEPQGDAVG